MSAPGIQGLRPWVIQRISAVVIALSLIYFSLTLLIANPMTESSWPQWLANPINNITMALFLVATLWHAWIGIRDIVLDYVHNVVVRLLVLTSVASLILGCAFWGVRVLYRVVAS